jgi:predicted esterase
MQLNAYVDTEGPFDGVIGYSQGASLAAMYLIQHSKKNPTAPLPFKCAIFFSGGIPLDPMALAQQKLVLLDEKTVGPLLLLPTANIWGRNDFVWPGSSEHLFKLCDPSQRDVFLHDEGHDIPGGRAKDAVLGSVRIIRRTIDKALLAH